MKGNLKPVLSVGIILIFLLVGSTLALAEDPVTVTRSISSQEVEPGDTFTVTVTMEINEGFAGMALNEKLNGMPDDWGDWTVTPVDKAGATFKGSSIEWVWLSASAGNTKTVEYEVTVPNTQESFGEYDINGIVKSKDSEVPFEVTVGGESLIQVGKYELTVNKAGTGDGSVSKDPPPSEEDPDKYLPGKEVELTATPSDNSYFDGWTGAITDSSKTTTVTMDSDKTVTANFEKKQMTVNVTADPDKGGDVSVSGGGTYDYGTEVTVTADPAEGYEFLNWKEDGTEVSTSKEYTFTAQPATDGEEKNLVANFALETYSFTMNTGGNGEGTVNVDHDPVTDNKYRHGTELTLTPNPAESSLFDGWTGPDAGDIVDNGDGTYSLTMNSDKEVTANFKLKQYEVKVSANPTDAGDVSGAGEYNHGTEVTVSATPNSGFEFMNWKDLDGEEIVTDSKDYTFEVTQTRSLQANFGHSMTIKFTGYGDGEVTSTSPKSIAVKKKTSVLFSPESDVTLDQSAMEDSEFVEWIIGDKIVTDSSTTVSMDSNKTVTAKFALKGGTSKELNATVSKGYNLFLVPGKPESSSPQDVFGDDIDPLYMYRWNSEAGDYEETGDIQLREGNSYWLYSWSSNNEVDVSIQMPAESITLDLPQKGWHMIGAPFAIRWGNVKVNGHTVKSQSSVGHFSGPLQPYMFSYNSADKEYNIAQPDEWNNLNLENFQGYWIKTTKSDVSITFERSNEGNSGNTLNGSVSNSTILKTPTSGNVSMPPRPPRVPSRETGLEVEASPSLLKDSGTVTFSVNSVRRVEGMQVEVYDLSGKAVWSQKAGSNELTWEPQNLVNGVYVYSVSARINGQLRKAGIGKLLVVK